MFIPLIRNVQEKMIRVSVVKGNCIIYISQDMFKLYEMALSESDGIELRSDYILDTLHNPDLAIDFKQKIVKSFKQ